MTHFQNYSRGTIPKAGKSNEHASSTSKEKLKNKKLRKVAENDKNLSKVVEIFMTINTVKSDLNRQKLTIFVQNYIKIVPNDQNTPKMCRKWPISTKNWFDEKLAYFDQNSFYYVSDIFYK